MKKKVLTMIFKSVMIFIFVLLIIPTNVNAATWSLKDVELSDVVIDNDKVMEYVVHLDINNIFAAQATGYFGIQKVPFVERYDDNSYGDFTDLGKVANNGYRSLSAVTSDTDFLSKYGIVGFSSDNGEGFPIFGEYNKIDRMFFDFYILVYVNGTYYVYLWTYYGGRVYPDALIGTIKFDGQGKISVNDSNEIEKKIYYTLKYETNGGSYISSKSILDGDNAIEPGTNPTHEGFEFVGWYADELLETPFDFNTKITNNTTIYAKWKSNLLFKGYDGVYDGEAHSIIIDEDMVEYTILYSLDGKNYNLSEAPKYTNVGNYTIYYKATKEGYEDLIGSVEINIKENKTAEEDNKKEDNTIEENPKTNDGISAAIIATVLSLVALVIASKKVLLSKKNVRKI